MHCRAKPPARFSSASCATAIPRAGCGRWLKTAFQTLLRLRAARLRSKRCRGQQESIMKSTDFVVARNDLQLTKAIETQVPDAAALPGEALLVTVIPFHLPVN